MTWERHALSSAFQQGASVVVGDMGQLDHWSDGSPDLLMQGHFLGYIDVDAVSSERDD